MKLRAILGSLALTVALVATAPTPASAHSFGAQGPPHTHLAPVCTPQQVCYRWILANGSIMQGNSDWIAQQYGYVLVWCSYKNPGQAWAFNTGPWGPWGNVGSQHPYCLSPVYSGKAWSIRP